MQRRRRAKAEFRRTGIDRPTSRPEILHQPPGIGRRFRPGQYPDYVPQIERIVVFDNDGTLWCEQPIPVQLASDSDVAMMEVASASSKPYLNLLVRHDDAEREYTYDKSAEKAQAAAGERGWTVVSMKNDWQTIFG